MSTFRLSDLRSEHSVDLTAPPPQAISTGSFLFDYLTGVGGLPRGRILEAFGPESSGKSTAMYQAMAAVQRAGGVAFLQDYENAFLTQYAVNVGLDPDPDRLLLESPPSLEVGFARAREVTDACARAGVPLMIVFDSLAAMPLEEETAPPKRNKKGELEEDASNHNMMGAIRAKEIGARLRQNVQAVADSGAIWAFINHELDVIHTGFVTPGQRALAGTKRTPGGRAVKFYASIRLQFTPGMKMKGEVVDPVTGEVIEGHVGVKTGIYTVKNKVAAPFRRVSVLIRFGIGIDNTFSVLDIGLARGLIERPNQQTYAFPDGTSVKGLNAAFDHLRDSPALAADLETRLRELLEESWQSEQDRLLRRDFVPNPDNEEPDADPDA